MYIKSSVCQSGGKLSDTGRLINEDGLMAFDVNKNEVLYRFIILMDGATGIGRSYEIEKGLTPAEWYVGFMMSEMKKIFSEEPTASFETVIESSFSKVIDVIANYEKSNGIVLENYEKPSATLSLLRNDGKTTDIYLLGDTETIVSYNDGKVIRVDNPNQKAVSALDGRVIKHMALLAQEKNRDVVDMRYDPEIQSMLCENRNMKNSDCEGGYWVCGTTLGVTKHGVNINFDNSKIDGIVLASDGFSYSILGLNENEVYNEIKKCGILSLSKKIRDTEDNDAGCNRFPRFKKSDDLTAVYIDYSDN